MSDESAASYGDRWADIYDQVHGGFPDQEASISFLADLAEEGPALEFAIGTGRVALPLRARGVDVHGLDASEAMVARLRAKPGGEAVSVTIGDMAETQVEGRFSLVYLIFNSLFGLLTQEQQVRCFANAARHLQPGGAFVIEAFVPDLSRFDRNQRVAAMDVQDDSIQLEVARHDRVPQRIHVQHVWLAESGIRMRPVQLRYAWPPELDLMARLAGLGLRERWGGWNREPFTEASQKHVSVYELDETHDRL
jgi:SAM-dependent methyltransferase